LYPTEQFSIAWNDTHQYVTNILPPITDFIRKDVENYLTSFNPRNGKAKIVYEESLNTNQTRFYLIVRINSSKCLIKYSF
jgi:hypothetical protein